MATPPILAELRLDDRDPPERRLPTRVRGLAINGEDGIARTLAEVARLLGPGPRQN